MGLTALLMRGLALILVVALTTSLTSCAPKAHVVATAQGPATELSIQEIMASIVDPAADSLWDAVGSTVTPGKSEDRAPRTDRDWQQARHWAVTLVEGPNLLVMHGRAVAVPGGKLDDADVPGITPAYEIRKLIDADPAAFALKAKALQDAGIVALKAIDARNAPGLLAAGGQIDTACENCHLKYWYPNAPRPPEH
jgi:methionine-rich copper-binding protein CopC